MRISVYSFLDSLTIRSMPLFMDFHKFDNDLTVEDVKRAHLADEAVQDKYHVKYHQFWVNQEAGTVFCLMEGPDKETCEQVHREAHGNIACAITEVEPGFYKIFMGEKLTVIDGHVKHEDGAVDLGYRIVMIVSFRPSSDAFKPQVVKEIVSRTVKNFNGRLLEVRIREDVGAVFSSARETLHCAIAIREQMIDKLSNSVFFRIGIGAGEPLNGAGVFFPNTILIAQRLNKVVQEGSILMSSLVRDLLDEKDMKGADGLKSLREDEESFILRLMHFFENNLDDATFSLDTLCRDLGISRPQLYRKITALTGRSPNDLIRDLKMEKAYALLQRKSKNISEIALELGYNNASYFSRCFSGKFGVTPSAFAGYSI